MIIPLKSVRFVEEVNIPGNSEKRGIGSFAKEDPPDDVDVWFDSDLQIVVLRHKTGRYSDSMTGIANVRDMGGLMPPKPVVVAEEPAVGPDAVTQATPVGTVWPAPSAATPDPKRALVIEKGPAGKGVGKVVVGDPDED